MTQVQAGQTYTLSGTFASGATLAAYGSTPGKPAALVQVTGTAVNNGTLDFFGVSQSRAANEVGATLLVSGVLTNNALIQIGGGTYGGQFGLHPEAGAQLIDSGTLNNAGTLQVFAALAENGIFPDNGTGGTAQIAGVLNNSGLMVIEGGQADFDGGAPAGTAIVSGVLTNTGSLAVNGAYVEYFSGPSNNSGALLSVASTGTLANAAVLTVQGGQVTQPAKYGELSTSQIGGAQLIDAGVLTNTGTLAVQAGGSGYQQSGLGGVLTIAAGGALYSSGVLEILGAAIGSTADRQAGTGATLTDAGALTNAGSLLVGAASTNGYRHALPGAATLSVTGVLTNTGSITVQGSVGFYTGLPGRPPAAALSVAGSFTNAGQLSLGGGGLYGSGYAGLGAVLTAAGVVDNTGSIGLGGGAGGAQAAYAGTGASIAVSGTFTNAGTLTLAGGTPWAALPGYGHGGGGAELIDTALVVNTGTIVLDGGAPGAGKYSVHRAGGYGATLAVLGSLDNAGVLAVGVYANAPIGALLTVAATGTLTNAGTITLAAAATPDQLQVSGLFHNEGTLALNGGGYGGDQYAPSLGSVTGTLINSGQIMLGPGSVSPASNPTAGATLTVSGVLINHGTMAVEGAVNEGYFGSGGAGVLVDSGLLSNTGLIVLQSQAYGAFGLMDVTGTFNNAGYLAVQYPSGASPFAQGQGGLLMDAGLVTNTGTIGVGLTGVVGAGQITVEDRLNNLGLINLGGEYIQVDAHATLTNAGQISNADHRSGGILNQGVLINTGTIALAVTTPVKYYDVTATTLVNSGTLIDRGLITLGAANAMGGLASIMTITATGVLIDQSAIKGGGTIDNAGAIGSTASGATASISVADLLNTGTVTAAAGSSFLIGGPVTSQTGSTGSFVLMAGATLDLAGGVAAGQSALFAGAGGTLALGDASAFSGIIDCVQAQTSIDFLKLDVTSATSSGTTLAIGLQNGTTIDLTLGAPLPAGIALQLAPDGHGGTDLHFIAATTH